MYTRTPTGRSPKGSVGIEAYQGRLRLRLPRELFGGKQKYLFLGLSDSIVNRKVAEAKAQLIESDIRLERFDSTLTKYGKQSSSAQLTVVEKNKLPGITPIALWEKYFASKRASLKPKTIEKYENFAKLYAKLCDLTVDDALAIKQKLEDITTTSRTRDALMYLSAACKWGMKHQLVRTNPFDGMAEEMPKHRYMVDPQPNAFTEAEREQILERFQGDSRRGMNYRHYYPFVTFLFFSGCRPSEAVGLRWKHISDDCGAVTFGGSLVQVGNQRVESKGSKNNKTRQIAISPRLQHLLQSIKPDNAKADALVFPSLDGDSINYRNFARRAWTAIVDLIKPGTTPYCARDTFITTQLLKGTPSTVIAKWCDTSTQMIDKNYADKLKLTQMRPID